MPTSNQSSTQTSFFQNSNGSKQMPTTKKVVKKTISNLTSKMEEKPGVKIIKTKNKSITRQQLIASDKTQDARQTRMEMVKLVDGNKCNT
jgi:nucleoside diphosphate kinase